MRPRHKRRTVHLAAMAMSLTAIGGVYAAASPGASAQPRDDSTARTSADVPTGPPEITDPDAPATYRPVTRSSKVSRPALSAGAGGFTKALPVTFSDGVSLRVDGVSRRLEAGAGPGVLPGRPQTAFTLTLTNGAAVPVDLTQVVVSATYGVRLKSAQAVYQNPAAVDFSAVVAPGATASATYVFSVPPGQAKSVRLTVDMDAGHAPATFTGLEEH